MNICVVGIGYVGLVTGACFAELGMNVFCVDTDQQKIEDLKKGKIPIYEPGLTEMVVRNHEQGRLHFSTDLGEAISQALVVVIAVGTPQSAEGAADMRYVWQVGKSIGQHMRGYKVIVTKSTVPVGTGAKLSRLIRENQAQPVDFDIVSNPEFLREGSAIEDFMRPNRVVVGAQSEQAKAIMRDLYSPLYLLGTPFVITDVLSAEMIKYASNAFLATKISFINEMANLCELMGADVNVVARGIGLDGRIGPKFLHAGPGYGGSCFPKDTIALSSLARDKGYEFRIVDAVIEVNKAQRSRMVDKIAGAFNGQLKGRKIAVLGLTFKPNTDDMRESPSLDIIPRLVEMGASIKAYDPAGMEEARHYLDGLEYGKDAYETMQGADALVLLTEWNQFRNLNWSKVRELMQGNIVLDLRNIYAPEKVREEGFVYYSVGRP